MTATRLKVGSARYYVTCPDSDDSRAQFGGARPHRPAKVCRTNTVASSRSPAVVFGCVLECLLVVRLKLARRSPPGQHLNPGWRWAKCDEANFVKLFLKLVFGFIFLFMVVMTIRTSLQISLWSAIPSFAASPWSMATLYDAYFGFLTFFCWLAWRERSLGIKIVWFVLIMALGSIAMSFYVLLQLFGLRADEPASALFRQKTA